MNDTIRILFERAVEKAGKRYDPEVRLLTATRGSGYNYHTGIRNADVHPVRESLTYALGLMDRNREGDQRVALGIIDEALELQDVDPDSPTCGVWPYYLEESIDRMLAPDYNWADFCGKSLVQVWMDYKDRLPEELRYRVERSIRAAAYAILRRNVQPSYTNISFMGAYVTLLAGEILSDRTLAEYGRRRLRAAYEYNLLHGSFTEYNSPTYTLVAIEDLSLMLRHIRDQGAWLQIDQLHRMAWETVVTHFHHPTGQWIGPHSRCYQSIQGSSFHSFLQLASSGRLRFIPDEELIVEMHWPRLELHCPEPYLSMLLSGQPISNREEIVINGPSPLKATTYQSRKCAIGTFNHSDLWNQRRPFIAYWGSPGKVASLRFRCLHDDYDFSSALLHTLQRRNLVLGVAHFCPDHGDKHIGLDRISGKITASRLLFRLEFGGETESVRIPDCIAWGVPVVIPTETIKIGIVMLGGGFEKEFVSLHSGRTPDTCSVDAVLYEGPEKEIELTAGGEAYTAFAVLFDDLKKSDDELLEELGRARLEWDGIRVRVHYEDECLRLSLAALGTTAPYKEAIEDEQIGRVFKNQTIR